MWQRRQALQAAPGDAVLSAWRSLCFLAAVSDSSPPHTLPQDGCLASAQSTGVAQHGLNSKTVSPDKLPPLIVPVRCFAHSDKKPTLHFTGADSHLGSLGNRESPGSEHPSWERQVLDRI